MTKHFFNHKQYPPENIQLSELPMHYPQKIISMSWIANCSSAVKLCLLLIACCLLFQTNAQQTISLGDAIDKAIKNNLTINNEKLKTEYAQTLIKSAANIPLTQVTSEFGSFNSASFDTRFGVSQSFALPAVYNRQKQLFTKEWESSMLNVAVKEFELKKTVTEIFYNHLYLQEKEKLLIGIDSLYENLLKRATLRLQKGESNVLERTTFENQRISVQLQMAQFKQQRLMIEELFQLLLNTEQKYIPSAPALKILDMKLPDSEQVDVHPSLKLIRQQQQIAKANTDVERSKLLPELMVAYNNMSIRGAGPNNVFYTQADRFHSGQVGLGFPIFNGAQKARIRASKVNEQIAANNFNISKQALQTSYWKNLTRYQQNSNTLNLYIDQYSKNSQAIKETANKQFLNGEINYLELVMLLNQAIAMQNGYIDLLNDYNQSVIDLLYFTK